MEDAWQHSGLAFLGLFSDLLTNSEANDVAAVFVRGKIRETVEDPDTARRLTPRGYPIFARRPCKDDRLLSDKWADGGRSHLGLMMEGFPNLFIIAGPNGPSALTNFILLNEQNVDWTCDCIAYLRANGLQTIEADLDAEDRWMDKVSTLAGHSLFPSATLGTLGAMCRVSPETFPSMSGGSAVTAIFVAMRQSRAIAASRSVDSPAPLFRSPWRQTGLDRTIGR